MRRSWIGVVLAVSTSCGLFAAGAFAHPASGIVVNAKGEVFSIHTGRGVCKIDTEGRLTYIHNVSGGGHWLALDTEGRFSTQFPRLFEKLTLEGCLSHARMPSWRSRGTAQWRRSFIRSW
jgi:hypothetical protein